VRRMFGRVCFYSGRANVFRRQGFQKRAQAVQSMQSKPCSGQQFFRRHGAASGNQDSLLAVRQRNDGSVQAHARASCLLPGMFPAPANDKSAGGIGATGLTASGFGERNLQAGPPAKLKLGLDMEVCANLAPLRESAGSLFCVFEAGFPYAARGAARGAI
jgi:hypothetical protein